MALKRFDCSQMRLKSTPLIRLAMVLLKRGDQHLQHACDITHAQLQVLIFVSQLGPISQHQLAQELDLTQAAISRLTETMVRKKILHRVTDPTNRRANKLTVTEQGLTLIEQAINLVQSLEDTLYSQIPEATLKRWQTTTTRILKLATS